MPQKKPWSLSVSGRVLLFTVVVWVGLLGGLHLVLQNVFHPTFVQIEARLMVKDLERVEAAVERETKMLSATAQDYASSDEVRQLVARSRQRREQREDESAAGGVEADSPPDQDGVKKPEGLRSTILRTLDLDAIFIFDELGRPVHSLLSKTAQGQSQSREYQPKAFASEFPVLASTRAGTSRQGSFRRGLMRFEKGTLVFAAAAPIVDKEKTEEGGRPVGNLVMLRELDEAAVERLAEQVRLALGLVPGNPKGPAVRAAHAQPVVHQGTVEASAWLHDPFGTPIAHYSVERPASILAEGEDTLFLGGVGSLAMLSLVLALLLILLQMSVVRPLLRLTRGIEGVRRTGDLDFRLGIQRADEIGVLAYNFDRLLALLSERTRGLEELASTDGLTKLKNRRKIMGFLEEKLVPPSSAEILKGRGELTLSVLLLDIDHFKRINDTVGHAVGDRVLRKVAETLRDTLEPGQEAGRFGGEEFLVVLPGAGRDEAIARAELVREAIQDTRIQGLDWPVTVSVGVASYTDQTAHGLIASADLNLYRAKESGRNQVVAEEVPSAMLPAASFPPPPRSSHSG